MQIAILGTRGIPNRYGGFERFAEVISEKFTAAGHGSFVLAQRNSNRISILENGVIVVDIKTPTWLPSNIQTLLYDFKSLLWASRNDIDIVLECGYSFAFWLILFPKSFRRKIVTNPDGIEFKRKKWSLPAKWFLKICERFAVKYSRVIVCDSPVLVNYYQRKFKIIPEVITYGANPLTEIPDYNLLSEYGIAGEYFLVISRFTPENSLNAIFECFSKKSDSLVVIGDYFNKFGMRCFSKYAQFPNIKFLGGVYNLSHLNALRFYSKAYIHGHSVGGTNPSLLEAMACKCFIIAHGNEYNRFVMDGNGLFFSSTEELVTRINTFRKMDDLEVDSVKQSHFTRISKNYRWSSVSDQYLDIFNHINKP